MPDFNIMTFKILILKIFMLVNNPDKTTPNVGVNL